MEGGIGGLDQPLGARSVCLVSEHIFCPIFFNAYPFAFLLSGYSCSSVSHCAQGHYARKLLNDLMEDYSNALRPVEDTDEALNVSLQITLSQIKDMVSRCVGRYLNLK